MIIFLVGVACVGKSTIGAALSQKLRYTFYDFDIELEQFYGQAISRLKAEWVTDTVFRKKAVVVLKKIIEDSQDHNAVVALPPSGLKSPYYRHIKASGGTVLWIRDFAENILQRIVFFDDDSKPIEKTLTAREKKLYLKSIREDIAYFGRTLRKADYKIDIYGLDVAQSAEKIEEFLKSISENRVPKDAVKMDNWGDKFLEDLYEDRSRVYSPKDAKKFMAMILDVLNTILKPYYDEAMVRRFCVADHEKIIAQLKSVVAAYDLDMWVLTPERLDIISKEILQVWEKSDSSAKKNSKHAR